MSASISATARTVRLTRSTLQPRPPPPTLGSGSQKQSVAAGSILHYMLINKKINNTHYFTNQKIYL